jgi:hypothetical protein
MSVERSAEGEFHVPTGHQVPMDGRGRLLWPVALRHGFWPAVACVVNAAMVASVTYAGLAPVTFLAAAALGVPFVASVRLLTDYARGSFCGSDGLWILLQTREGVETLVAAGRLARARDTLEACGRRGVPAPSDRWDIQIQAERPVSLAQRRLIDAWIGSGRPYGPQNTRFFRRSS